MQNNTFTKNYVIGNWKMNGSWEANSALLKQLKELQETPQQKQTNTKAQLQIAVCPPDAYLFQGKLLENTSIAIGAQNVSEYNKGAYTGQTAYAMLHDFNCKFVLIGHSERRELCLEDNTAIANKLITVLKNNQNYSDKIIQAVVCVGETKQAYEAGQTTQVISAQIHSIIQAIQNLGFNQNQVLSQIIIAYEPIWAIGTGLVASKEEAQQVCALIHQLFNDAFAQSPAVLYGGSVKVNNAYDLALSPSIQGFLVGGASLNAQEFNAIIEQTAQAKLIIA